MTKESRFSLKAKARVSGRKYEFFFEYYFRERKEDFVIKSDTREDGSYEIELIEYPEYQPKNELPVIHVYSNEELAPGRKFLSYGASFKSYMDIVRIIEAWSLRNIIYLETGTIVEDVLNFDLYFEKKLEIHGRGL